MELMQASRQWASRPADERYTSLTDMLEKFRYVRAHSREAFTATRSIRAVPVGEDHKSIAIEGPNGHALAPTNWAFGQLASLADAPASYLRKLPAELAADCLNAGLHVLRDVEDIGLLLYRNGGEPMVRAATGPRYGRIWNEEVLSGLVERFGDGVSGDWRVPGEFGKRVAVTTENTTLYAGDRDMFVFLADEDRRITIPNRRNGEAGTMARGFFCWNSEVGAATFGIATFLFDYVCCNRIVWGATQYRELKIRHTSGAPSRFLEQAAPILEAYAQSSDQDTVRAIEDARKHVIASNLDTFLANRFSKGMVGAIKTAHEAEEGRPIETRWDAIVGATAVARGYQFQDSRVELERKAGDLLSA